MFFKDIFAAALLATQATATIYYAGVAESSGEFGVYTHDLLIWVGAGASKTVGTGLPGTFGVDYKFINESAIDVYVDQNHVNLFRVAFLLERMCPVATGLGASFNETHYGFFVDAINYITTTKGAYAILDPHNYMRYNDPSQQPSTGSIIGDTTDSKAATTAQFAEFWGELAGRLKDNEKVIFGLNNEVLIQMQVKKYKKLILQAPRHGHESDPRQRPSSHKCHPSSRSKPAVGLPPLPRSKIEDAQLLTFPKSIIAPGNGYTGGHSWTQNYTGNSPASSAVLGNLTDPVNNTAFDIHEYLDSDFSGSHANCSQSGPTNLAPLTAWLKTTGFKAMITEFGGSNSTGCAGYITGLVNYMAQNEEYIGWTAWAAGPLWGSSSPCCGGGNAWGSLEPGSLAADGSPGFYATVWEKDVQPLVPVELQWSGVSSVRGGNLTSRV
ncbi:Endoglucanase 1 [Lachnellula arida]|uniref:cellulase n=1 Tax=Lachnellula arida TaxID=1316785 RepID=A0A8T9B8A3_9HELO|nr:Endoglucanase 1 [Lachnellula arida]